jgi:DNA-directed RNA polymerase specialized sigma24 family protein
MAEAAEVSTKLYGEIYRFLRRRTGSNAAAEDLTPAGLPGGDCLQDVAKWKGKPRAFVYDREAPLGGRVQKARTQLRPARRRRASSSAPSEVPQHTRAVISAAIDGLDPEQREVVILKLLRGLSFTEVAYHVGTGGRLQDASSSRP